MRVTEQQALGLRDIGYIVIYPTDMNGNKFGADMDYLPTLDDAIRWLRQAKGAHVAILYNRISNVWDYIVYYLDNTLSATGYPSHDHAQSAGLDTAIDYVKKQQI